MRIVSWNLWAFDTDRSARRHRIIQTLSQLEPDVCCLQEVRADRSEDLATTLSEELSLHDERTPPLGVEWWRQRLGDDTATVSNVILSRWPATDVTSVQLPLADGLDEGRSALLARLAHPRGPVLMVTTQLASAPGASALRVRQVRSLAAAVVDRRTDDDLVILTGDLNAEADSDEVRMLCGHKTRPAAEGLVLLDAWRFAPPGNVGWTWDRRNPYVEVTGEPSSRIDYLLVGPLPTGRVPRVAAIGVAGTDVVGGTAASDHFAVVADVGLADEGHA